MSGNLLNNDNKTNYLFKKENFKAQTRLEEQSATRGPKTITQEGYQGKSIVLQESIFAEDISKNIPSSLYVGSLYFDNTIPTSSWNNVVADQNVKSYDLSTGANGEPSLGYYKFYKRVYLEPVEFGNPFFWWVREDQSKGPTPDNNLLSKMVPGGLSSTNDMFNPIVEFYDTSWVINEKSATFALPTVKNTVNWTIDYATGILALNVSEDHLNGINYTLDATSNAETDRPRISFIRYEGNLGSGSSGSGGSGGGISDASYNELKDDIELVNEKIDNYLFDVPEKVIGISHQEVISNGSSEIHITWQNPEQKCAAFDFYQVQNDEPWSKDLYQTYYVATNGLSSNQDNTIWKTIKRSMNKLPFHEQLRIQFKSFDPNQGFQASQWTDFREAQINNVNVGVGSNDSGKELYPIFKDITKVVISSTFSGSAISPIGTSLTTQDITGSSPLCYISKNFLDNSKVYHFRVALDNRACINGKEFWEMTATDISNNLNWATVPTDLSTYIELGSYGPAPAPTNIQFVTGEDAFEPASSSTNYAGTITASAGNGTGISTQVMDLSFNTAFPGPSNLNVEYGFALSGDILSGSRQVGSRTLGSTINANLHYANENSFTFDDLSFNTIPVIAANGTGGISQASFNIDTDTTLSGWNKSLNFNTNFPHGIALPEHTYDISRAYMANNKFTDVNGVFPFKAYIDKNQYNLILPDESGFASPTETSTAVFQDSTYMDSFSNNTIDPNSTNPGYKITLTNAPTNYYGLTTELKEVRDIDQNTKYVIFLQLISSLDINFNSGGFSPAFTGSNNVNFITCPQTTAEVGEDIVNNTIATYDISFNYYKGSNQSDNALVSINGYNGGTGAFPSNSVDNVTVNSMTTSISVDNDDPTGVVSGRATKKQEQFGGYYNIQKVMNTTGVSNITLNSVDDVASQTASKYDSYSIILRQTLSLQSNLERKKTINLLIGEAPNFDISVAPSIVELGSSGTGGSTPIPLSTNCNLFGAKMPDSNILFHINNFGVSNINTNWIWPTGPLMDISFDYFYDKSNSSVNLDTSSENYNNPVTASRLKDWDVIEPLSGSILVLNGLYNYSRAGKENNSDAQFKIRVNVKNNIYSTASNDQIKTENYYSNSGSSIWDWSSGNGNNTLWWDYTYSGNSILNGGLPDGFISIIGQKSGSRPISSTLQLQRKSILSNNRYWLGGNNTGTGNVSGSLQTTNHEWYDTDYDHSNTDISDNQILWADGAFRCGGATGTYNKDTNILNPYTSYDSNYYAPPATLLPNYTNKFSTGETWNYTILSGEHYDPDKGAVTYTGNYKWLLTRLSWSESGSYTGAQNPWNTTSSIEVYVSENNNTPSFSNKLTLGDDYLIYFCVVGSGLSTVTSMVQFSSGTTKYRSGWLDGQRKYSNYNNVNDGAGCFDRNKSYDANGDLDKYVYTLPTLGFGTGTTNNSITDIFIRIGIKNQGTLTSASSFYNNNKMSNVSVKLNA